MQTFIPLNPLLLGAVALVLIVCVRKRGNIHSWWTNLCDEAECSSTTAKLYQALEHHEHQLLLEHAQADTIRELEHHASPALAALAHDLQDYINPLARLRAIQQAIERQAHRRNSVQLIVS